MITNNLGLYSLIKKQINKQNNYLFYGDDDKNEYYS